jgi:EAL domain-containing protein (putative c-di-GMP-specific phosphodiesterase class I)
MLEDLSEKHQEAAAQTEIVGEKILASLNASYLLAGHDHHSTPSIGATQFSGYQNSVEDLLKQADLAMYQAKSAGRNALRFFDPEMQSVISQRVSLEADLRQGVHNNEFVVFYQPQVNDEGALTGAEALIRWQHPERGLVPPNEFIPLAEENGLIVPLGRWVLDAACAQLAAWARQQHTDQLSLAVNVSARQFRHPDFVDQVLEILARHNTNPQRLKLELTESMLVVNVEEIITKMSALKAHGVSFSLDDFGTGFSSLSYLKRLPLDQLKIDRSFVRDMLTETDGGAIVQAIIALGQTMGLSVIAEGVETEAQRNFLDRLGCHDFQGYLFGQPLPLGDFEHLASRNVLAACRT